MTVEAALTTYLRTVDAIAPGLVEGLYVVGSYALNDWREGASDINVVAVTAEPATNDDFDLLRIVHAQLAEIQPQPAIDGPYLAWGDLVIEPATGLHRPWTLTNRLHHDGDCFEINPILWYTLANYGVAVRGPSTQSLDVPFDTEARIRWVVGHLQSYWADVARQVEATCDEVETATFESAAFVWCTLGSLRSHFTAFTGDVTSKRAAGEYGLRVAPRALHGVIRSAMAQRAAGQVDEIGPGDMRRATEVIRWCIREVSDATNRE